MGRLGQRGEFGGHPEQVNRGLQEHERRGRAGEVEVDGGHHAVAAGGIGGEQGKLLREEDGGERVTA